VILFFFIEFSPRNFCEILNERTAHFVAPILVSNLWVTKKENSILQKKNRYLKRIKFCSKAPQASR